ncbi:DUF1194 domain-containing protein [Belnapia sp. T6]|uniref:DUF1194 domain-containing protein n=1 Tax=Belnapia mucosa TaxID=2804532 RepID=A0ABS1UYM2_9PROT|nr:DUF1194 domain-containing protein [Belnapia mucosa]MBL6454558.1 DUF1194 domain-containing protein [Belnapia mucosa]
MSRNAPVDLLLVLAVDGSSSIDDDEDRLQRDGYCAALSDTAVLTAIRSGVFGSIGLAYVEWSGHGEQQVVAPWTRIASQSDAAAWSAVVARRSRPWRGSTSISSCIEFARLLLARAPWDSNRRVIDISGDGPDEGRDRIDAVRALQQARESVVNDGITINGLALPSKKISYPPTNWGATGTAEFYTDAVIGGKDAFVVEVTDQADFIPALRRKLVREIASGWP